MKTLFWHRRDLRIEDNSGLYYALKNSVSVQPIFIFDSEILGKLDKSDQRVLFIYREIEKIKQKYKDLGSDLHVFHGNPVEIIPQLCIENEINALYTNKDYEPYAIQRDKTIFDILKAKEVDFIAKKDHVIFEKNEILKGDRSPYTIFTPYSRRWKEKLNDFYLKFYPTEKYLNNLAQQTAELELISLQKMGFESKQLVDFPSTDFNTTIISEYSEKRDIPSLNATSRLSLHLRFGTISVRKLAQKALETNQTYLNELIWRDFYQTILYHFPHSATDSFKKQYDRIEWKNNEKLFELWCEGKTGYPLVDAGMRELNETGFMHNRVRMVVASFLCKHLLIDWRWGERYFAEKLLDFDLASNTGGWQWASGSGCDAAPYFRVFNPQLQQEKFDKDFTYIKKWVSEFGTEQYPEPIVEHKVARDLAIATYKLALT